MAAEKSSNGSFSEFEDQQGISWNIDTKHPDKLLILECLLDEEGKVIVRTVSNEVGWITIGEPTLPQLLSFVDQAQELLPDAPFTLHLVEYVRGQLKHLMTGISEIDKGLAEFIESKTSVDDSV